MPDAYESGRGTPLWRDQALGGGTGGAMGSAVCSTSGADGATAGPAGGEISWRAIEERITAVPTPQSGIAGHSQEGIGVDE